MGGAAVVVDFTATWCGPCKMIAPAFEKMAAEFPQVTFIKVDVDQNAEVAQECQISAMPTFKCFRDKKEVGMVRGANEQGLREMVAQYAGDKWSVAGEGYSLSGVAPDAAEEGGDAPMMSEREKRLAALAKRGL